MEMESGARFLAFSIFTLEITLEIIVTICIWDYLLTQSSNSDTIIIIISIFKKDNVFRMTANLP